MMILPATLSDVGSMISLAMNVIRQKESSNGRAGEGLVLILSAKIVVPQSPSLEESSLQIIAGSAHVIMRRLKSKSYRNRIFRSLEKLWTSVQQ